MTQRPRYLPSGGKNANPILDQLETVIQQHSTLNLKAVFDPERPIGSTGEMCTWYATRI